ncbi:MAG TPA: YhjD/YihY/BrkB family envelope integrity protein [Chloroflexia bacterium]|nr:YhjD/YihY/BrkB family envelope integrity protein [Chloroflexia bacterium]
MSANVMTTPQTVSKSSPGIIQTGKTIITNFLDHDCLVLAAAIVYYTLQSLVPLLLGFIAVVSLVLQGSSNRKDFIDGINNGIPSDISNTINLSQTLDGLAKGAGAIGIVSVLLLLWTGSGIFAQFMMAINKAFGIPKDKRNFMVKLGLRLLMLPVLGLLFILSFAISAGLRIILGIDIQIFGVSPANFSFLLNLLAIVTPFLIQAGAFAVLYRLSPNRKGLRWKPLLVGALVASFLVEILKVFFSFYINVLGAASNATKTYGALGGIIVFLLFIYLFAAIVLFGAEIASALHHFAPEPVKAPAETAAVEEVPAVTPATAPVTAAPVAQALTAKTATAPESKNKFEMIIGMVVMLAAMGLSALIPRRKA